METLLVHPFLAHNLVPCHMLGSLKNGPHKVSYAKAKIR